MADVSTRERILEEAMRLFAERGFRGTSVAEIESAAGLSAGSGALYHHFSSKDAVLSAGVARHLARLDALRDIRKVFAGVGDLRTQLAVTARYYLAELDSQADLLRLVVAEGRRKQDLLSTATHELVALTYESFTEWLEEATGHDLPAERARAATTIGMGALLASRLTRDVLGANPLDVDDELLVTTWTDMMFGLLDTRPEG
ncbi:MAG: TetR/AcrR family transcriptional regulator [Actinomycetota bacterium]|nr:TetR/AcrR family transcriptional regulator [Actinomycetota bacterium]